MTTYANLIVPGLFLGCSRAFERELDDLVADHKVSLVVRCLPDDVLTKIAAQHAERLGCAMYVVPVRDSEASSDDLFYHFETVYRNIERHIASGHAVLVHCQMGVSRSASVVVAYVMKSQDLCLDSALALVKRQRPEVNPNTGFLRALVRWEERCTGAPSSFALDLYCKWSDRFPQPEATSERVLQVWSSCESSAAEVTDEQKNTSKTAEETVKSEVPCRDDDVDALELSSSRQHREDFLEDLFLSRFGKVVLQKKDNITGNS
eukprot:PhM_4_TR5953/c0_g1_i1/m.15810